MTTPTDAPVEERHRRAAVVVCGHTSARAGIARFIALGDDRDVSVMIVLASQVAANAERDGCASRDAEVEMLKRELASISEEFGLPAGMRPVEGEIRRFMDELRAYRRAWERVADAAKRHAEKTGDKVMFDRLDLATILAEELARKGTP